MDLKLILQFILWPPLIGFIINGLFGSRMPSTLVKWIACLMPLISFVATFIAIQAVGQVGDKVTLWDWFRYGKNVYVNFEFYMDQLSLTMLMVITGVGFLIHVYSSSYMDHDKGYWRFFSYLNLFLFSMIILVLGSNLLVLFVGWEGVGLCSFLLIGFWFDNDEYNAAARKAFIMNRIGDLGFLLAIAMLVGNYESIDILRINDHFKTLAPNDKFASAVAFLLFVGVTGKSAQIPLFTWLPDAMAGPTPVSALIHAATMVTAGIYLVARMSPLYAATPMVSEIVTIVGILTAILAASIALKQNDIKKVLAYSTVSQLGYMVAALGVGAYTTAIFHVVTHAFFKALLFLSAGSVIHGLSGEQDIRKMGGLKSKMKWTHLVFLIGTLAISGVPPLAGFFSKDEILAKVYLHSIWFFIILAIASVFTAWYMFRLYFMTFHGNYRGDHHKWDHAHESPALMIIPLCILAILSAVGGFMGMPEIMGQPHILEEYIRYAMVYKEHHVSHFFEIMLWVVTVVVLVIVIFFTWKKYSKNYRESKESSGNFLSRLLENKYYLDEIYDRIFVKPGYQFSKWLGTIFESRGVHDVVMIPDKILVEGKPSFAKWQSGHLSWYLVSMVIGLVLLLFFIIIKII